MTPILSTSKPKTKAPADCRYRETSSIFRKPDIFLSLLQMGWLNVVLRLSLLIILLGEKVGAGDGALGIGKSVRHPR